MLNLCQPCASQLNLKSSDLFYYQSFIYVFLLTHLGSNQDSAEPKSDVLPITPWVNIKSVDAAKLNKISI
ncbi:MAG: hypothetical protein QG611_517 [Bacteroidota bacterium]|nr:hypothetical protein [Bacteroidota bacterium]